MVVYIYICMVKKFKLKKFVHIYINICLSAGIKIRNYYKDTLCLQGQQSPET